MFNMPNRQSQHQILPKDSSHIEQSSSQTSISTAGNRTRRHPRVSRACNFCRLKKQKCDSSTPCALCVRRGIHCIRRKSRRYSKPQEFHDTLINAVHALYQNSKGSSDMTEAKDASTHAMLESLNLIEQTNQDSEAAVKNPSDHLRRHVACNNTWPIASNYGTDLPRPFRQDIQSEIRRPNDELEVNMAKLVVLICSFLPSVHSPVRIELTTYERHLQALEEWSSCLPQSLRHFPDSLNATRQSAISTEDEFASVDGSQLYLEVFYFASVFLLTSPLLLDLVTMRRAQEDKSAPLNLRFFAQQCTDSAIQIAYVSTAMVRRGYICQRSWMVTALNYHACLILALSLSVKASKARWKLTSAQEAGRRQVEMNRLKLSMAVLSYCAQQDSYAGDLFQKVSVFKGRIDAQELSEAEQPPVSSFPWTGSRLGKSSVSYMPRSNLSSETTSSGTLGSLDLTPSTVSSTFDLQPYPSRDSISTYASAQQFGSSLAQSRSQSDAYSMPLSWSNADTVGIDPAMDLTFSHYPGPANPLTQYHQPFSTEFDLFGAGQVHEVNLDKKFYQSQIFT